MNRDGAGRQASLESTSTVVFGYRIVVATNHDFARHFALDFDLNFDLNSLPNRRIRTRMSGGVGRRSAMTAFTRLPHVVVRLRRLENRPL
jgi:hypothetical protein